MVPIGMMSVGAWGDSPWIDGARLFLALLMLLPLFVMLDAMRPWRHAVEEDFDVPKEGMTGYVWLGGILLFLGLLGYLPSTLTMVGFDVGEGISMLVAGISGLARFLMVVLFFAYLKRVVLNAYMRRYRKEMRRQDKLAKAGTPIEASSTTKPSAKSSASDGDKSDGTDKSNSDEGADASE